MDFRDGGGILEVAFAAREAVGLDFAELLEGSLELAREARAVEAEGGDGAVGVDDVEGDGGFFVGWMGGAMEHLGFEGGDSVEAPGGVGKFLSELRLGGGLRAVLVDELAAVLLVGGLVFRWQEGGAAGEAVAQRVARGTGFAFGSARAGGVLGVGSVDGRAIDDGKS